ncbi:ABC transporter ATP-binding protein (plasmid) [Agrobacterium vitis]|uniref:ABC transporter nucleotide binding/ATPase protein n=2 Tax=Rhizobium/Agrobacterium group TaxID=227290 RepID=B9K4U3_ALLAM|nr:MULTISPECIES: ABC transporter ATP-binding protein [Rhizobium/Agrobacterium group]ACM39891.1 ABC transporter nucleotide binding/ATPase protein [Allorhizobium ampelinum S4]MCF1448007.1 ABC transporter ATP-binding protein [Allorhizobium ampelinum]MCF1495235.1 ABC transporter ATP-binding protein [Allorhizobium ampelinum]MUO28618.1 dipeptide ABC transporter ATP-binding protein [Agrobacterium vitis]MUO41519.1 dipeptide ABC transporter ATP-binding protein [Agrobacterium vitis]
MSLSLSKTKPVLRINSLSVDFPGFDGNFRAVDDLSLTIARGEVLGVIGESGAGKSMTGAAIIGLIDPPGRITSGEIHLQGERIDNLGDKALETLRGRRIGTVFQDPLVSLNPLYTIGQQLIETIRRHLPLDQGQARQRAIDLLREVGIDEPARRLDAYPHEFSGGMRQRVVIALAVAADPDLLIADEPTSALDVSVQAQIIALLKSLCQRRGLAVLLITHDMGVVAEIANRVVVMHKGRIVESGSVAEVIGSPKHDYTRALIAAIPSIRRKNTRASVASKGDLVKVEGLIRDFALPGGGGLPFFSKNRKQRSLRAVNDVSFSIGEGQTFALVGESGSGKSTIARIVVGLLGAQAGKVTIGGTVLGQDKAPALKGAVQMIFQDPYASLNSRWRIGDIIAEPIRTLGLETDNRVIEQRVTDLLEKVRLDPDARSRFPHEFSGGQRQRIAIARALASRPRFIVCDEPTSALDVSVQAQVLELMASLQAEFGLTYLLISHNLAVVRQMADRVGVLKNGVLVEEGPVEEVFERPQHDYTRMLIAAVPDIDDSVVPSTDVKQRPKVLSDH